MDEWQPIQSAPQRFWVLVFLLKQPSHFDQSIHHSVAMKIGDRRWLSAGGGGGGVQDKDYEPIYWMPLPDPPENAQ